MRSLPQKYDNRLILQHCKARHGAIEILPSNMKNYISFSVGGWRSIKFNITRSLSIKMHWI